MKDTRSIEERVAELTESQKKKIICTYRWDSNILGVIVALSVIILLILKDYLANVDTEYILAIFGFIVMALLLIGFIIFKIVVAVAVPYYDKHVARYIIKTQSKK